MRNSNNIDAVKLLETDHRKVEDAFDEYKTLGDKAFATKKKLADKICSELITHTTIEEELLYPLCYDKLADGDPLLDEARVEHASAKELISQIQSMDSKEALFDAKVTVLGEYIRHHVKEEETELFPMVKDADIDLVALGQKLQERKQQLSK